MWGAKQPSFCDDQWAVKPLLLTMISLAALVGLAGPARADYDDDAFLASLRAAGITFPDPGAAIGAGRWVCQAVGRGTQMADVVKTVQSQNPGLHGDNAARFTAIAANVYCPQSLPVTSTKVDGGA
ncbi:Conserved exported protein of uncharacterised function (modular protein) [Mycobacterium terramassiliense]|uniref:Conserved exported protein of uncharacterized function (Modular protein) n=1 Tax=Mycobacterium terramassiliense TaxID=1841859 RepID=A0A2U3N845_9MYCO|nr:Conserved exported protein of uncharacterised function (modular protein) [Mycobacterium terramassiliense]